MSIRLLNVDSSIYILYQMLCHNKNSMEFYAFNADSHFYVSLHTWMCNYSIFVILVFFFFLFLSWKIHSVRTLPGKLVSSASTTQSTGFFSFLSCNVIVCVRLTLPLQNCVENNYEYIFVVAAFVRISSRFSFSCFVTCNKIYESFFARIKIVFFFLHIFAYYESVSYFFVFLMRYYLFIEHRRAIDSSIFNFMIGKQIKN